MKNNFPAWYSVSFIFFSCRGTICMPKNILGGMIDGK